VNIGTGVQAADGEGRPNRFGISRTGSIVDRVLFATKPLEALKPASKRNASPTEGLVLALAYDRWVSDSPQLFADDVNQWDTSLRYGLPKFSFGSDLFVGLYHAYRWDTQYGTALNSLGLRATSRFGPLQAGLDVA